MYHSSSHAHARSTRRAARGGRPLSRALPPPACCVSRGGSDFFLPKARDTLARELGSLPTPLLYYWLQENKLYSSTRAYALGPKAYS